MFFRAPRDDQGLDNADLGDRGDNALVAHRLLDRIGHPLRRQNVRERQNDDLALKSHFDRFGHVRLPLIRAARPRAAAACASPRRATRSTKLLIGKEATQRIDDKGQPGLRQIGLLDQQRLPLRFVLVALDQRRRGDLSGVRCAAASVGLLAALIALQYDPPDCQDLIPGQQLILVGLGERPLNIAVGGAGNFHGDIGRHDAALDRDRGAAPRRVRADSRSRRCNRG